MIEHSITAIPSAQQTFAQIELELGVGMVPRIFLLLAPQPALLVHLWGQFRTVVLQGELPRSLKEMTGLAVAAETQCDYVRGIHLHSLSLQGIEEGVLEAFRTGDYKSVRLSSKLRSVLTFALDAARARSQCNSTSWDELRQRTNASLQQTGLTDSEKFELVATITLFEQICAVANLLGLDPAQP